MRLILLLDMQVTTFPFGWAMLRFKADNPGVWPLHCHIEVTELKSGAESQLGSISSDCLRLDSGPRTHGYARLLH